MNKYREKIQENDDGLGKSKKANYKLPGEDHRFGSLPPENPETAKNRMNELKSKDDSFSNGKW